MTRRRFLNPLFGWRGAIASSQLPANARHVALTLSLHMSELGDSAWPSVDTLAEEMGRDRSTVLRGLAALRRDGFLSIEHRYREDGSQTSSYYTATVPDYPQGGSHIATGGSHSETGGVAKGGRNMRPLEDVEEECVKRGRGRSSKHVDNGDLSPELARQAASLARAAALAGLDEEERPPATVPHPKILLARLRAEHPAMDTHRHPSQAP